MYVDFQVAIKKLRLRDPLTKIMGAPDVYLRAKVPEDMYDTLQKFAELRKLDRASLIQDFNLFPITENLLTLERKYGDSLNFEDLNGFKQKRKRRNKSTGSQGQLSGSDLKSESKSGTKTNAKTDYVSDAMSNAQTILSQKPSHPAVTTINQDDDDESEEETQEVKKRKADTDCKNVQFNESLKT